MIFSFSDSRKKLCEDYSFSPFMSMSPDTKTGNNRPIENNLLTSGWLTWERSNLLSSVRLPWYPTRFQMQRKHLTRASLGCYINCFITKNLSRDKELIGEHHWLWNKSNCSFLTMTPQHQDAHPTSCGPITGCWWICSQMATYHTSTARSLIS